jgi:tetratricopeptide (TPR) repeat protein
LTTATPAGEQPKKRFISKNQELLNKADALAIKADLLANQSRYEEANRYYDQALAINPNNPDLWAFKAINLSGGLHRNDEALQCWERAKKLDKVLKDAVEDKPVEAEEKIDLSQFAGDSCRDKIKKLMQKQKEGTK